MEKFLTVREVAERLGIAEATVYLLLRDGKLEHYSLGPRGRTKRISEEQLAAYLESVKRGGSPKPVPKAPAATPFQPRFLGVPKPGKLSHFED